jgi:hypothetical protein
MEELKQEEILIDTFKKMSIDGKTLVIERALLVKKIEDGLKKQYGLDKKQNPQPAA